jgi:TonB family protein
MKSISVSIFVILSFCELTFGRIQNRLEVFHAADTMAYSQFSGLVQEQQNKGQEKDLSTQDPTVIQRIHPTYPESALKDSAEGTVLVQMSVDKKGNVIAAKAVESTREDLAKAATDAAMSWRFKPALANGAPVEAQVTVPIKFTLIAYPIKMVAGHLEVEDIESAFDYLGLKVKRLKFELPYKCRIQLGFDRYDEGKLVQTSFGSGSQEPAGKGSMTLYIHQKDTSVQFTARIGNGSIKFAPFSINGLNAQIEFPPENLRLMERIKNPLYIYAADSHLTGSLDRNAKVADLASKYKLVYVLYIGLRRL